MTDKEKLNAIRTEVKKYIDAARKAHTNITEGNFAHLLSFIDTLQEEPVSEDLPKIRERKTLDEYAYQCAYDMSNDWAKDNATWKDVQSACKLGAKWQKAKDQSNIELAEDQARKACDAYCKVCGHYAHTTPVHICRQACDYYKDFKKYVKGK